MYQKNIAKAIIILIQVVLAVNQRLVRRVTAMTCLVGSIDKRAKTKPVERAWPRGRQLLREGNETRSLAID
jgi:hypothetical protein